MMRRCSLPSVSRSHRVRWLVVAPLAVGVFVGCASPWPDGWPDVWPSAWSAVDGTETEAEAHRFPPGPLAVAVALPSAGAGDAARMLDHAGVRAANAPCDLLRWHEASDAATPSREPAWAPIDAWVREVHAAGLRDLALCLDFVGAPAPDATEALRVVPAPARLAAFAAWVGRVVERYDADGEADMDGLVAPVRRFRLGGHLEAGGVEPFVALPALLSRVHAEMRAASPEARLVLPPFRARGDPPGDSAARIERLAETRGFDAWSLAASGSPDELDAWLGWLARRTPDVPVEVVGGVARPLADPLTNARCDRRSERYYFDLRTAAADRCALEHLFFDLLAREVGTTAWVRGHVARDVAHKAVLAASRGVTRAELGSAFDATGWTASALEEVGGLAAWSGWLDPESGGAYPVYYAAAQLDALLRGRSRVVRAPTTEPGVALFALDGEAGPAWVAWYDPPGFVRPGHPPPVKTFTIHTGVDALWLEQLITDTGTTEPLVSDGLGAEGRLRLDLTPTPLFVTPDPGE